MCRKDGVVHWFTILDPVARYYNQNQIGIITLHFGKYINIVNIEPFSTEETPC